MLRANATVARENISVGVIALLPACLGMNDFCVCTVLSHSVVRTLRPSLLFSLKAENGIVITRLSRFGG